MQAAEQVRRDRPPARCHAPVAPLLITPLWGIWEPTHILSGMGSSKALHSPRYKKFLGRLVQARVDAGLTQTELARAIGRSQTWVSKCELGERRVDIIELEDIAQALGKQIEWFGRRCGEEK